MYISINSTARRIASLNRQLKSIRTSAFIERENDDSKFVEPIGADSFNDALDGLERRVRVIKNKLDGRLLYDLSNKELDDIKESLSTLIEFTKDAKAKMSDQKSHSGSSKIPAEFKADEDQASWNKFYDKERSEAIKSEAYYKLKTKLASVMYDPSLTHKDMSCEEYLNGWDQGDLFSEMYWGKDFSSERAFEAMKYAAEAEGIHLTDADTWDYDGPMYEAYKNDPDKGLS